MICDVGENHALVDLPVETVRNPAYEHGQATSVATGIGALPDRIDAAVVALGDMPFVDPETVDALIATYRAGSKTALAAAYRGTRGNPVLFAANLLDDLTSISDDSGGRHVLLGNDRSALVETADPGVIRDVDVPRASTHSGRGSAVDSVTG